MSKKYQTSNISIKNVSISFGSTRVVNNVSLEIKSGEFFSFLGPSGSGKTTLLRAISGFGPKPQGTIKIDNDDITDKPAWQRNVGMVFQNYALWPHMTVRQNIAFGLEQKKVPKTEITKLVDEALDLVELKHLSNRFPGQLSGGQQQRVALARTIVVKPRILLLDEPLSNLDASLRVQMRRDIFALQRKLGLTTVFVTHDQEEANTVSDRIAVLKDGVVQQVGKPIELYDRPVNKFVASFLGSANVIAGRINNGMFQFGKGVGIKTDIKEDKSCDMLVRPQSCQLSTREIIDSDSYIFSGKVRFSEYLGQNIRYFIEVDDNEFLVDKAHIRGAKVIEINAPIYLAIRKDQALFL